MSFATALIQTSNQLGPNARGAHLQKDAQLNTLTVSDKTILNCVAINTDRLKCIDVLEMTGRAVFNGDVTFLGPVFFLDGTITLCSVNCPTDFTLTAGNDIIEQAGNDMFLQAANDISVLADDGGLGVGNLLLQGAQQVRINATRASVNVGGPNSIYLNSLLGGVTIDSDDAAANATGLLEIQDNGTTMSLLRSNALSTIGGQLILGLDQPAGEDFTIQHQGGTDGTINFTIRQPNAVAAGTNSLVLTSDGQGDAAFPTPPDNAAVIVEATNGGIQLVAAENSVFVMSSQSNTDQSLVIHANNQSTGGSTVTLEAAATNALGGNTVAEVLASQAAASTGDAQLTLGASTLGAAGSDAATSLSATSNGGNSLIRIDSNSNTGTGAMALGSSDTIALTAGGDVTNAIHLLVNGGTAAAIDLQNTLGTSGTAIDLNAQLGGFQIQGGTIGTGGAADSLIQCLGTTQGLLVRTNTGNIDVTSGGRVAILGANTASLTATTGNITIDAVDGNVTITPVTGGQLNLGGDPTDQIGFYGEPPTTQQVQSASAATDSTGGTPVAALVAQTTTAAANGLDAGDLLILNGNMASIFARLDSIGDALVAYGLFA